MPLPRWALALANDTGLAGGTGASLAAVDALPNLNERTLVAEAQAGNRAAFEELVHRYDRDVLAAGAQPDETSGRCAGRLSGSFPQGLPQSSPFSFRMQLLHLALSHRHQRLPGSPAAAAGAARGSSAGGELRAIMKKASRIFLSASVNTVRRWIPSGSFSAKRFKRASPRRWSGFRRASELFLN